MDDDKYTDLGFEIEQNEEQKQLEKEVSKFLLEQGAE